MKLGRFKKKDSKKGQAVSPVKLPRVASKSSLNAGGGVTRGGRKREKNVGETLFGFSEKPP